MVGLRGKSEGSYGYRARMSLWSVGVASGASTVSVELICHVSYLSYCTFLSSEDWLVPCHCFLFRSVHIAARLTSLESKSEYVTPAYSLSLTVSHL